MSMTGFTTMGRTAAELVAALESHLYGTRRAALDLTTGSLTDTATVVTVSVGNIIPGSYIEVDDECMYVVSASGLNLTVLRGQLGSQAVAHGGDAIVRINPRFTRVDMLRALREEIASWPAALYAVMTGNFTVNATRQIDLDGMEGKRDARLLRAQREMVTASEQRWVSIHYPRLIPDADQTDYPSGWGLKWPDYYDMATNIRVIVGCHFDTSAFGSTKDLGEMGLRDTMLDIPPLGAAARLVPYKEIARTDDAALARSRLAEEVPPGSAMSTGQALITLRDKRIGEEIARQYNDFGMVEA